MTNLDGALKSQEITLLTKVCVVKAIAFPVQIWESDRKEGWAPNNWCVQTVVVEKTLESLLDSKEIKPVNPNGNQPWIFIGRIDTKAEAPIVWPPDAKSWLTGKDSDAGKEWGKEEKGQQGMKWLEGITDSADMSLSEFQEIVIEREAWHAALHGVAKSWTQLSSRATVTTTRAEWSYFPVGWGRRQFAYGRPSLRKF